MVQTAGQVVLNMCTKLCNLTGGKLLSVTTHYSLKFCVSLLLKVLEWLPLGGKTQQLKFQVCVLFYYQDVRISIILGGF